MKTNPCLIRRRMIWWLGGPAHSKKRAQPEVISLSTSSYQFLDQLNIASPQCLQWNHCTTDLNTQRRWLVKGICSIWMEKLWYWSTTATNKARFSGKDEEGLIVLTSFVVCSTNINNKCLWMIYSLSEFTVLFWFYASLFECLQLDAWCGFICIICIWKDRSTLICSCGWILGVLVFIWLGDACAWFGLIWPSLSYLWRFNLCFVWHDFGCPIVVEYVVWLLSLYLKCKSLLNHFGAKTAAALLSSVWNSSVGSPKVQ